MIIKEVSIYFSISPSDLKSKKRIKSILIPRQVAIYLSRELTDSSLVSIGEKFGGKDHATIIHSINKIKDDINVKKELKSAVEKLMMKLKST